ncbi:transcription elongation factor [Trypanosoma rangeli]|uniref:Transcription elongation factor n=1 Tax=Trypanosoma rangeli TaxID=5698 RepID=A0A422P430_TRYRA|nr:transcription elongation factor [Trypanosoma rangeli]RNF12469.1 transcription elongation factor [Trypanosoma rangeli]|eukprot:RNF12469.1 transcription elongation factor [Trypanosoma rangeli]
MSEEHTVEMVGVKRPRPPPITSGIAPKEVSLENTARVSPKTPLPLARKSAMGSPIGSVGHSTQNTTPGTPTGQPLIRGVQGCSRTAKWSSLIGGALMQGRAKDEESIINAVALRIAAAIPGDRSAAADGFRVLLVNLRDAKNIKLREDIIEGRLPVEVLVRMSERDLLNPEAKRNQEAEFLERSKDTDLTEIRRAITTKSTLFPCPSCKARDCSWTQKQTRSADEPMTVFCVCNVCEHKWRRY